MFRFQIGTYKKKTVEKISEFIVNVINNSKYLIINILAPLKRSFPVEKFTIIG